MIGSLGILNFFILLVFLANSVQVLLVGQILCGLCWGVFATLAPAYASEVAPTNLRGYLTTYVNLCWAIGQLIAAGVLTACLDIENQWGYRIPFAVQWVRCLSAHTLTSSSLLTRAYKIDLANPSNDSMLSVPRESVVACTGRAPRRSQTLASQIKWWENRRANQQPDCNDGAYK